MKIGHQIKPRIRILIDDISKYLKENPNEFIEGIITVKYLGPAAQGGYNVSRNYNFNKTQPATTTAHYTKDHDQTWLLVDAIGILSAGVFPNVIESLETTVEGAHVKIRANRPEDHKRH
jgi:hypothetical protein